MLQIIPGVLEHDWDSVEQKLELIKTFANTVHVDIIDGKFVNNKTFLDPEPFKKYSDELLLELHMMVIDPERLIEPFGKAGFKRFLGHVEHMTSQKEFVEHAKLYGGAGLALDGPTHISAIKVPFEQLNAVLIYTSNRVGFSGPPMMDDRLDKIRHLRKLTNVPIEVDGGVNDRTLERVKAAGATRFIATSNIWTSHDPAGQYRKLQNLIQ
jgi:ribulose-phosphate 3-epimerase